MTKDSKHTGPFADIELQDGQIEELRAASGSLWVTINDWKEEKVVLEFFDVVGIEAFSPIGEDLSHGTVEQTDAFIDTSCGRTGTARDEVLCFTFWSAWHDMPIMRIVARSFEQVRKDV